MLNDDPREIARAAVRRLLRAVGLRWRLSQAAFASVTVLVLGGSLAALVVFTAPVLGTSPSSVLVPSVLTVAAAWALTLAWVCLRPLSDMRLARWVDRRSDPGVASAAVLEVLERGEPNRVEQALLRAAPVRMDRLRAQTLRPPGPSPSWIAAAVLACVAVPVAALATPLRPPAVAAGPARPFLVPERSLDEAEEDAARKVERFAHLLFREAESHGDARVGELAMAVGAIHERMVGGALTAAEAWNEIGALSEEVARSLGYGDDATFRAGDGAGEASVGAGAQPATNRERATPMLDEGRREEAVAVTDAPRDGERVLDSLLERLEADALARSTPDADADLSEVNLRRAVGGTEEGMYFDNPEIDAANEAALRAAEGMAARADRGGAAAGDAAGLGGQEAGGGAQPWDVGTSVAGVLDELAVGLEALALPDHGPPGARRLRILAAPPPSGADEGETLSPLPPPGWAWSAETYLGGHRLTPGDRLLLSLSATAQGGDRRDR